jgi:ferredoxin-like protein FixX
MNITYDWWCDRHEIAFVIGEPQSHRSGGLIRVCPACVYEARERVAIEITRFRKTRGFLPHWLPFEGWH